MTRLEPRELATFRALQTRAPFRLQMMHVPQVHDVTGLLSWLDAYLVTLDQQIGKLREEDRVRARAAAVLAGLRTDLRNAVSTLDELDAAIDAGDLEVTPKLASDHRRPYVGEGADGARRSAEIDRTEAEGLDRSDPRLAELLGSARAWERQAAELAAD